jgi:hypothetical protein
MTRASIDAVLVPEPPSSRRNSTTTRVGLRWSISSSCHPGAGEVPITVTLFASHRTVAVPPSDGRMRVPPTGGVAGGWADTGGIEAGGAMVPPAPSGSDGVGAGTVGSTVVGTVVGAVVEVGIVVVVVVDGTVVEVVEVDVRSSSAVSIR